MARGTRVARVLVGEEHQQGHRTPTRGNEEYNKGTNSANNKLSYQMNPKATTLNEEIFKFHPEFITVTCLNWKYILTEDRFKHIIIDSLSYLSGAKRVRVYAFVIMSNHFHLIWKMMGDHKREDVQRDFLKFTSQQILKHLRNETSELQSELLVNTKDRKLQVWERNSLSTPLWSKEVFIQKLDYIHDNPVRAGLCQYPEEYIYSSAKFYIKNEKDWSFLVHYNG